MPRPTRLHLPGIPQHITQRGNNRQASFYANDDYRLYLDMVTGGGLNSTDPDESEPIVMLDWSDDGGRTFGHELHRSLGADGQYLQRVAFNNLGTTGRQGRIFRVRVSAAVARCIKHAMIEGDLIGT